MRKSNRKVYIAGSSVAEWSASNAVALTEIRSRLARTKFDKNNLRILKRADLIEAEWNFTRIMDTAEAYRAGHYEYARENRQAYGDFQ